jgi:pyruvate dehydrogenase E1 component beta subunit
MAVVNMVQALNAALRAEMKKDPDVVVLGEDVGADGGVFRVTEGLLQEFGPERVIDTPLSESGIVGAAIGMSVYGLKPVAEIQFMGFIYGAMEQILSHAARIRSRSRGRYACPLVIRTPYGAGIKAPELHSESTEALFCQIPGLKVVAPSNPYNAKGLLLSAIREPDPVIFLEPSRLYRLIKQEVPEEEYAIPLGRADLAREGGAVTVIAWGSMLERAMKAVEDMEDIEVLDLMTLSPFDEEAVFQSVRKTGRLLIVQEAPKTCGLGAELSAFVAEEAVLYLKGPILRVTGYDAVGPLPKLEDHYIPTRERIRKALEQLLKY